MEASKSPKALSSIKNTHESNEIADLKSEKNELSSTIDREPSKSMENNATTHLVTHGKRKSENRIDDEDLENLEIKKCNRSIASETATKLCQAKVKDPQEQKTPEQLVFSNDYLLWTILKDFTFEELKQLRQVDRLWNLEATKLLLKSRKIRAIEVDDLILKSEAVDTNNCEPLVKMSFPQFSKFVSQSSIFPCYSLRILDLMELLLLNEDSLSFFQAHGHLFDKLKISFGEVVETGLFAVQTYFGKYFPNLTSLTIKLNTESTLAFPSSLISNSSFVQMKKLKKFKLRGNIPKVILERLLRISPNLERICWTQQTLHGTQCKFLKNLVALDAISLLRKVRLTFKPKSIETYEQILEKKVMFEEIDEICFHSPLSSLELNRAAQVLTKLLKSCSQTVTKIKNMYLLGDVLGLKFPVFPKVTFASVFFYESNLSSVSDPTPLLPPGTHFSNLFPNLAKFEFVFRQDTQIDSWTIFQEPIVPLKTVKELNVSAFNEEAYKFIPTGWVRQLCEIFPNVTRAQFPTLYETALEHVWRLGCLEELNFELGVKVEVECYPKVDSAFTGFSEETVKQLYTTLTEDSKMSDIDFRALCVNPSIADLKNLKKLSVELVDQDCGDDNPETNIDKKNYSKRNFGAKGVGNIFSINDKVIFSHVANKFFAEMCPHYESFQFDFDPERIMFDL